MRLVRHRARRAREVHRRAPPTPTTSRMLATVELDAVVIATPSALTRAWCAPHSSAACTSSARSRSRSTSTESRELAALAPSKGLVTQVGYHNRFVGAVREVKRLLDAGAIGTVTHVLGEAYGPVVLQAEGRHLAQPQGRRAAAASTTTPPTRSTCSTGTSARPTRVGGHRARSDLLARDRRRGLQHPVLRRRDDRAALGQLVRRVVPQDDDQDHRLGHDRPDLRRPPGDARSTCATAPRSRRATSTAGTSATPPS